MSLGKIKKKLNVEINKKCPLTSRNDKDISYDTTSKMLKKLNKNKLKCYFFTIMNKLYFDELNNNM